MSTLETDLLKAHEKGDQISLVALYRQAAEQTADPTARAFFLTHAYVFALESGLAAAQDIHLQLVALGCDEMKDE
ncbi:hypothetical protein [Phaeobacter sp. NW0010-22]|uniref:hypothetical protein n=1 Tax=Phaeobacter sp. NW0010-22 TaxID=3135907 RepID=UPI0031044E67